MKRTRYENHHIKISPTSSRFMHSYTREGAHDKIHQMQLRDLQQIADQIKRHVDDVIIDVIEFDTIEYCEFCGRVWETERNEPNGMPECCGKAQDEWERDGGGNCVHEDDVKERGV